MSEIKKCETRGLQNVLSFCEAEGVRVHTAGFSNGDVLELDTVESIETRTVTNNGIKYAEFTCKLNGTKQWKSIGALYRQFLEDGKLIRPNNFENLSGCLTELCGKKVKLTKVEGATAPVYCDDTKAPVNITCFKVEIVE